MIIPEVLNNFLSGELPPHLKSIPDIPMNSHHWNVLSYLWTNLSSSSISFVQTFSSEGFIWDIREFVAYKDFHLTRNCISLQRITISDPFGLIGLSLVNPRSDFVVITEGVSDFFTVKLLLPSVNVLGFTTLGGNSVARTLVLNLFNNIVYCADNDLGSNTGLNAAFRLKSFLEQYQKSVKIIQPVLGKDMSDNLIYNLSTYLSRK